MPVLVEGASHEVGGSELANKCQLEQGFPASVPQANLLTNFGESILFYYF